MTGAAGAGNVSLNVTSLQEDEQRNDNSQLEQKRQRLDLEVGSQNEHRIFKEEKKKIKERWQARQQRWFGGCRGTFVSRFFLVRLN